MGRECWRCGGARFQLAWELLGRSIIASHHHNNNDTSVKLDLDSEFSVHEEKPFGNEVEIWSESNDLSIED